MPLHYLRGAWRPLSLELSVYTLNNYTLPPPNDNNNAASGD